MNDQANPIPQVLNKLKFRVASLEDFLAQQNTYLVTTKGNYMVHDEDVEDLFLVRTTPFGYEGSWIDQEGRDRIQKDLGVELLNVVRVYSGNYYRFKAGHCFAFQHDPAQIASGDIMLKAPLKDSTRKMVLELFNYISGNFPGPVCHYPEPKMMADVYATLIIQRSSIAPEPVVNLSSLK